MRASKQVHSGPIIMQAGHSCEPSAGSAVIVPAKEKSVAAFLRARRNKTARPPSVDVPQSKSTCDSSASGSVVAFVCFAFFLCMGGAALNSVPQPNATRETELLAMRWQPLANGSSATAPFYAERPPPSPSYLAKFMHWLLGGEKRRKKILAKQLGKCAGQHEELR